jgi:hypothetical protein
LVEEVSFLAHAMNKNEFIVNTLECEYAIAPVLKLPRKIVGYVTCTNSSQ